MSDELRVQIYRELDLRETDDLLEIWKTNDRVEWSDTAFDVLKEILSKRIGEIPSQDEPILKHEEPVQEDKTLEDWEAKLLNDENQPELYEPLKVLMLKNNIDKVAVAAVVINILIGLMNLSFVRALFQGTVMPLSTLVQTLPNIVVTVFSVALQLLVLYFPLKALSQILRILMEMEFNSRKAKS